MGQHGLRQLIEARELIAGGELRRAERLLREAVSVEHPEVATAAAAELGRLMEQRGEHDEAMAWWQLTIEYGGLRRPSTVETAALCAGQAQSRYSSLQPRASARGFLL
jgi:hypothetical protein